MAAQPDGLRGTGEDTAAVVFAAAAAATATVLSKLERFASKVSVVSSLLCFVTPRPPLSRYCISFPDIVGDLLSARA